MATMVPATRVTSSPHSISEPTYKRLSGILSAPRGPTMEPTMVELKKKEAPASESAAPTNGHQSVPRAEVPEK